MRTLFDVPWSGGNEILLATLAEIDLPIRIVSSMRKDGIVLVGSFVQLSEITIYRKQAVGRKSLAEAKQRLQQLNLSYDMKLRGWNDSLAFEAREARGRSILKAVFERSGGHWKSHDDLESELISLLREVVDGRNLEILSAFYGFDTTGPKTLESVGQIYGLTRERVRQISAKAERKLLRLWRPTSKLFAAIELIKSGLNRPFNHDEFTHAAKNAGIINSNLHVLGVLKASELIGQPMSLERIVIGGATLYGSKKELSILKKLIRMVRKDTSSKGCTNIQRLQLQLGTIIESTDFIRKLLTYFPEVKWLDEEKSWLISSRSSRNRLANIAKRVFSVAQTVEINELRSALLRPTRVTFVPPGAVLAKILENYGVAVRQGDKLFAGPRFKEVELGVNDLGLVLAFEELGSPLSREQLEDFCLDLLGMNANSFYVYLSYSPFIIKLATGVFSLIGKDVVAGKIEAMQSAAKDKQFEMSFGWSKIGTLWWHLQSDRPMAITGTHVVPNFVMKYVSGEWIVRTGDGLSAGTALVRSGFISGLKTVFEVLGVSSGDYIQFDFNIAGKELFVRNVSETPEEIIYEFENDEFEEDVELDEDFE